MQWINVNDKLPEFYEDVIILSKWEAIDNSLSDKVAIASRSGLKEYAHNNGFSPDFGKVLYWMYLELPQDYYDSIGKTRLEKRIREIESSILALKEELNGMS